MITAESSTRHLVLDRSPKLHGRARALGLSCPHTAFLGWRKPHAFVCERGHAFTMTSNEVLRWLAGCPECMTEERFIQVRVPMIGRATGPASFIDACWPNRGRLGGVGNAALACSGVRDRRV